jgi:restriction system protein
MPEEIGIALIIIVFAGWLLIKTLQAFGRAIGEACKTFSDNRSAGRRIRLAKKKTRLSQYIAVLIPNQLDAAEEVLESTYRSLSSAKDRRWEVLRPLWVREDFKHYTFPPQDETYRAMKVDEVRAILQPEGAAWGKHEGALLCQDCRYPRSTPMTRSVPSFTPLGAVNLRLDEAHFRYDNSKVSESEITELFEAERRSVAAYNERRSVLIARLSKLNVDIEECNEHSKAAWETCVEQSHRVEAEELAAYKRTAEAYVSQCEEQKKFLRAMFAGYSRGAKADVINRVHCVLSTMTLPRSVPRTWDIDFDEEERILVVDICLPDIVHHPPSKTVLLKSGPVTKPLNQSERKELVPRVHPAILLRVAHEVFDNDQAGVIKLLVLNGWVKFDDPSTGLNTKAYTASLTVEKGQIASLNLCKIDPLAAFDSLHGKSAGKLIEIIPIEPTLSLNRKDSRFVDAKAVLGALDKSTNLAAMDWQDFEHLIRELFEKEFAGRGAEVKITQASRDRGVDAIAFDPDPIHGGKYVIQAKRYTNTVDVSAVRDLCAVVTKEGASRGILVTTSNYGSDAYAFANNSPITLLNGAQLLGILEKHGYRFRIDLREARAMISQSGPKK